VNSARSKHNAAVNCRWNLKDAIKVFLAYVILMFVGMPLIARFISVLFGFNILSNVEHRSLILFISLFINLLICTYILFIVRVQYHQSVTVLGLSAVNLSANMKQGVKRYAITLPVIILAGFIINLISSYYGQTPEMQDVVRWVLEEKSLFILVSLIFFGIVIAPVIEEIMFRGFLQPALKNSIGSRYAIVVSASLFAAVHMDIFAFFQIFILGILLGYLYEKTQTLVAPVVVHILHNSLTLIFLLYFKYFLKGKVPVF
jgi:membrane protease YdiL (CAAX protease family)